jgi:hypothetical protein
MYPSINLWATIHVSPSGLYRYNMERVHGYNHVLSSFYSTELLI